FFFSSRRRHTRSKRDWSSDVCSSDLAEAIGISLPTAYRLARSCGWEAPNAAESGASRQRGKSKTKYTQEQKNTFFKAFDRLQNRSEERRVGKECRGGGWAARAIVEKR